LAAAIRRYRQYPRYWHGRAALSPFVIARYKGALPRQGESTGMAKAIDGIFALLLLIGAVLHGYGTVTGYQAGTEVFVWSLAGSLAAALIAVLNLLRRERRGDRALALICLVASLAWVAVALGFGAAIGNLLDPRVLWHAIAAAVLAVFSLRSLTGRRLSA